MDKQPFKKFVAIMLFSVGTLLTVGSFLAIALTGVFGIWVINPYLPLLLLFPFVCGLILVLVGSKLTSNNFKSQWPSRITKIIRWLIAIPFLQILFIEILRFFYGLLNGVNMNRPALVFISAMLICSLLLWPELRWLSRALRPSANVQPK